MNDKYYMFRKFCDLVNDFADVTDADMNNLFGEIEIVGTAEDGSTITVKVSLKEGEKNGN